MKKIISNLLIIFYALLAVPNTFAHVTVKPAEVGVGARSNFIISVPTEEDVPTIQVRLIVPEGMKSVRPNDVYGWDIQLVKVGEGDSKRVSEIIWSGGTIGVDLRHEFVFSAQVPANETSLTWKAYQTYANGEVVAWDADPKTVEEYTKAHPVNEGEDDHNAPKPYSVTKIVNDLEKSSSEPENVKISSESNSLSMVISMAALLLSVVAIGLQLRSKNK